MIIALSVSQSFSAEAGGESGGVLSSGTEN